MAEQTDTLPAPPPCSCLADLGAKIDKLAEAVESVQKDVALINNYLHDRQVHGSDRVTALPPLFESVPDDDTPTNPGG